MVNFGLLGSLVAVQTCSYLIAGKWNAARAKIATIVGTLEAFCAGPSRYATNEEGLAIRVESTASFPDGFLKKVPRDPYKPGPLQARTLTSLNPYVPGLLGQAWTLGTSFANTSSLATDSLCEILCLGADGREGGDAHISSEALDAKSKYCELTSRVHEASIGRRRLPTRMRDRNHHRGLPDGSSKTRPIDDQGKSDRPNNATGQRFSTAQFPVLSRLTRESNRFGSRLPRRRSP